MKKERCIFSVIKLCAVLCSVIITGCNNISGSADYEKTENNAAYIKLNTEARTVFPVINGALYLDSLTLYTKQSEAEQEYIVLGTWTSFSQMKEELIETEAGIYDFKLEALCKNTKLSGTADSVEISEGKVNTISIPLEVKEFSEEGEGDFSITLRLPPESNCTVTACLLKENFEQAENDVLTSLGNAKETAMYDEYFYRKENVPSGSYIAEFKIYKNGIILNTIHEAVTVAENFISSGTISVPYLEPLHKAILIIPQEAVFTQQNYNCNYSRHTSLELPDLSSVYYEDHIFKGWKKVNRNGSCYEISEEYALSVEKGTGEDRVFIASFEVISAGDVTTYCIISKIGTYKEQGKIFDYMALLSYNGKKIVLALENSAEQNIVNLEITDEKIEVIGAKAFESCLKISTAVIGRSVKCIEPNAFSGCDNLYSVIFPSDGSSWYITNEPCSTEKEILLRGKKVDNISEWNTAILIKGEYSSKYWYKVSSKQ